ncbi:MAG: hypothetical protein ACI95T_001601, partial [Flavobacteriales bacterium]
ALFSFGTNIEINIVIVLISFLIRNKNKSHES